MSRENAEIGIFITLNHLRARRMLQEVASASIYTPEYYPDHRYPCVQVLTI